MSSDAEKSLAVAACDFYGERRCVKQCGSEFVTCTGRGSGHVLPIEPIGAVCDGGLLNQAALCATQTTALASPRQTASETTALSSPNPQTQITSNQKPTQSSNPNQFETTKTIVSTVAAALADSSSNSVNVAAIAVPVVLLLVLAIALVVWCLYSQKRKRQNDHERQLLQQQQLQTAEVSQGNSFLVAQSGGNSFSVADPLPLVPPPVPHQSYLPPSSSSTLSSSSPEFPSVYLPPPIPHALKASTSTSSLSSSSGKSSSFRVISATHTSPKDLVDTLSTLSSSPTNSESPFPPPPTPEALDALVTTIQTYQQNQAANSSVIQNVRTSSDALNDPTPKASRRPTIQPDLPSIPPNSSSSSTNQVPRSSMHQLASKSTFPPIASTLLALPDQDEDDEDDEANQPTPLRNSHANDQNSTDQFNESATDLHFVSANTSFESLTGPTSPPPPQPPQQQQQQQPPNPRPSSAASTVSTFSTTSTNRSTLKKHSFVRDSIARQEAALLATYTPAPATKAPKATHAVTTPFTPTRRDETLLVVGDLVSVTRTYDDGWVFVLNLSRREGEGVVPGYCLTGLEGGAVSGGTVMKDGVERTWAAGVQVQGGGGGGDGEVEVGTPVSVRKMVGLGEAGRKQSEKWGVRRESLVED
ncbi:hypothetical protein HDU79_008911 [Rhizoclosmatium sp. JEL0117]|nr:hypothetical protein HDU79_008911 [Rhizoclosmatium sp. JEL0117]